MAVSSTSQKTKITSPAGPSDDPAYLAEEIKKKLEKCKEHSRFLIEHAIQLGELLIQAKKAVPHGEFTKWLDENCHLGARQAQRYMLLAKHPEEAKTTRASFLSLRAAVAALTKGLDDEDEASSSEKKNQDDPDADYRDELAKHKRRCRAFRSLRKDETSLKAGPAIVRAVKKDLDSFVHDVVKVARRHGRRLSTKELRELGADEGLVAMVLVADATDRLDPLKSFAPKKATK